MTGRKILQLPLDVGGIDTNINDQILNSLHELLFHLKDLTNGRKYEIGTLKE